MAKTNKKDNGEMQGAAADVDRDLLSQRAYERYLERGGEHGQDLEDWLTAERELRERRNRPDREE